MKNILFLSLCVLSVAGYAKDYQVTSLADKGMGTLREALEKVETGDTVTFLDGLNGTLVLESDLPILNQDVVISGPKTRAVTLNSAHQIFDIDSCSTIENLIISYNNRLNAGNAVVVRDSAVAFLNNVIISHYEAFPFPMIHVETNGSLLTHNLTSAFPDSGMDVSLADKSAAVFGSDRLIQQNIYVHTWGKALLYKVGKGNLGIGSAATPYLSIVVDEGTLRFNGSTERPIYTMTHGTLEGSFYAGSIINRGTIKVGSSTQFGKISSEGCYKQDSTGTLVVKIDPSGQTDQIVSKELETLGDIIIQLAPGDYGPMNYTILKSEKEIQNTDSFFEHVYFDIPGVGLDGIKNSVLAATTNSINLIIVEPFTVEEKEETKEEPVCESASSPVSKLYNWMLENKKRPKKKVIDVLRHF